jgi:hypothetical protein
MTYKQQMAMGRKVEREHKGTYAYMKKYHAMTGRLPPEEKVFESISSDHLKEDKEYYSKLKKSGL